MTKPLREIERINKMIKYILKRFALVVKCTTSALYSIILLNISLLILSTFINDSVIITNIWQLIIFTGLLLYEYFSRKYILDIEVKQ